MKKLREVILRHIIISMVVLICIVYIIIVVAIFLIRKFNLASWDAISALGEWAGIIVAILIPIAAIYLEKQLEKNKSEIKDSNISLYDEIAELKCQINEIKNNSIQDDNVKLEIYKFICISMVTTTKEVMEKFNLDFNKAKEILLELSRVDGVIRPAYISDNPDDIDCNWSKKR